MSRLKPEDRLCLQQIGSVLSHVRVTEIVAKGTQPCKQRPCSVFVPFAQHGDDAERILVRMNSATVCA